MCASPSPEPPQILAIADGARPSIAYRRSAGKPPGIVFLGGFASDMTGTKASRLEAWARARGQAYLRFDYRGHGQSQGRFSDATIGGYRDDALAALDELTDGPQILVGSSMGGWIALLAALARPDRVAGLVGLAAAPDFTEDLIWARLDDSRRTTLARDGVFYEPSQYGPALPISRALIDEGRNHLLLRETIPIAAPVRLIHGMNDPDVPWRTALRIAEQVTTPDVRITLVKDGDHRLSRDQDLALVERIIAELLDQSA